MSNNKQHKLSFFAIFSLIVGSLMGAGIFDIPQNIAHSSGAPAIIICWLITALGMLAMVLSMLYVNKTKPNIENGMYGYAKEGFGEKAAFNIAWGYWLSANIGTMGYFLYIFSTLSNFKIFGFFANGNNLQSLVCSTLLIWTMYFLICRGIKEASIINIIITTLKIASLIFILLLFLHFFNLQQFIYNYQHDSHVNTKQLLQQVRNTMMVTVWDFLGIECALVMSSIAKNKQDVRVATLLALLLVIVITSSLSLLSLGILPTSIIAHLHTPSTTSVLEHCLHSIAGIIAIADFIRIAIIICVLGAFLAWVLSASYILFEAAKDGTMPKIINSTNKHNVPHIALLMTSIFLQLGLIISFFTQSIYIILIQISSSMLLMPYLLTVIYACKLSIKKDGISFTRNNIINILAIIYVLWLLYAGGIFYFLITITFYLFGNIIYNYFFNNQTCHAND
jgi:arginine:ornithine antiporter/lysine permease